MAEQANLKQEFLKRFLLGIILEIKKNQNYEKNKKLENERLQRVIESEKLKVRFEGYEQVTKLPAPIKEYLIPEIKFERPKEKPQVPETKLEFIKKTEIKTALVQAPSQTPQKPILVQPQKIKTQPITKVQIPPQMPLQPGEIDFDKITFLTRDHLVTYIECPGENTNIIIKRAGATLKTQITLNKEEIMNIIRSFSEKAKIPLIQGMLIARVNDLEISAVTSETLSPTFIIKRILIEIKPTSPTQLERTITTFQKPTMQTTPVMPPVSRPFIQSQNINKIQ